MTKLNRREFLETVPALAAASNVAAAAEARTEQSGAETPLLDIHQHTRYNGRPDQDLLVHQAFHHVTKTVLLPGEGWMHSIVGDNTVCEDFQKNHPDLFLRFACSDPAESRTLDLLRGNLHRGAIGIGELKFKVAVDSAEMHRIYRLAEELRLPVLIHFEFELYNTGLERFHNILKAYPKVNFIGHAQTWWGNISAGLNQQDLYPKGPVKPGGLTDRLLTDYPNMFGDLSADSGLNALTRDPDFAHGFVTRHTRKLLWGSDCDCRDGKGAGTTDGYCIAARSLAALKKLVPNDAAFRRITYENGAALMHL